MIYYDEYGSKDNPAILMLHGAGALDTFCQQYRFSDRYHLIVPHLPGAGKVAEEVYDPEKTKQALYELIASLKKDRIGLIGHSLGGQLAVMLVSERPELFDFAVFLSAWVCPKPDTIKMYCSLSGAAAKILHLSWLVRFQGKYWNYTEEQAKYMAAYSKRIDRPQLSFTWGGWRHYHGEAGEASGCGNRRYDLYQGRRYKKSGSNYCSGHGELFYALYLYGTGAVRVFVWRRSSVSGDSAELYTDGGCI